MIRQVEENLKTCKIYSIAILIVCLISLILNYKDMTTEDFFGFILFFGYLESVLISGWINFKNQIKEYNAYLDKIEKHSLK
ncbi:hypothetical protein [Campylobacter sp. CCUG 57310]|uniref:hypothetical protein n=1 Tax=Campylobacter sp. CCUG 57310 TaxID=2517362 RepID=UPI001566B849|nr:hypothetical protein [Campylobacter sp. CCUG 57310]QKF93203.1 hypothetical protein CORI_a017 [Campylobacter sp. CCUG 57310]